MPEMSDTLDTHSEPRDHIDVWRHYTYAFLSVVPQVSMTVSHLS